MRPPSTRKGQWDEAVAARLPGKTVLVGMTHMLPDGSQWHEQFYGVIASAVMGRGILLDLQGSRAGKQHMLPSATTALVPAQPGVYTLKATGEQVVDPDYLSTWTMHERGR